MEMAFVSKTLAKRNERCAFRSGFVENENTTARLRIPNRWRGWGCEGEASGAGGIRTLVQTTVPRAFHMLLPSLVFESQPGKDTLLTT